jgi:Tfp pilus assembly protein PilV
MRSTSNSLSAGHSQQRRLLHQVSQGFTIVEVAIAAAILALVIATTITTMQRSYLSLDSARNTTLASQILQTELEKMRVKSWSTVSAFPAGPTAMTVDTSFTSQANIGTRFSLSRTVSTLKTGMLIITLTVSWKSYDGRPLSLQLMTYYGKDGLYDYFFNTA